MSVSAFVQVLALVGVEVDPEESFSVSNLVQWGIFNKMEVCGLETSFILKHYDRFGAV